MINKLTILGLLICGLFLTGCGLVVEPYAAVGYKILEPTTLILPALEVLEDGVPESVVQGDLMKILLVEPADDYYAAFNNKEYRFAKYGGGFYVLIPVSYNTAPGKMEITITTVRGKVQTQEKLLINILSKDFEEQSLVVSTSMQQTRSQENLNKDGQKVLAAKQEHLTYPLWREAFMEPVETYRLSTSYGLIRKINGTVSGRHSGLDMAAPRGTPVYAVNDGIVRLSEALYVTGNTIIVDHGMALYSGYGHLDTLAVEVGDYVLKGQQIATVGSTGFSTGPHLHFTFTIGTTFVNPEIVFGEKIVP
jgi:murein DD-endopeptidase MepM/ murein hydrolase activator NlpD